jgi:hypothetical protein
MPRDGERIAARAADRAALGAGIVMGRHDAPV